MQPTEKLLPYESQVHFGTLSMKAMRDSYEPCQEGDLVNIFDDKRGNYLAIAFGLRNMGFYIGVVMALGAPIGFGRVVYVVGDMSYIYYAYYPQELIESENGNGSHANEESL